MDEASGSRFGDDMLMAVSIATASPVDAMQRGATITCRAQQVHVGGPPGSNLDHVTGYLHVDNWDTSSGHSWLGYVRVWSTVANKYWRAHGHLNADSYGQYRFSIWIHVPFPTATVNWRPHCSL
jgi:hypothetical protein